MKAYKFLLINLLISCVLTACSSLQTDPTYNDPDREKLYKNGSLLSDNGGVDIFGDEEKKAAPEASGIGVNGFLWRASLDTISFMPIASADPFGGVIITDWYSSPETPNERLKLNVFIRGRDLRADGIKVSVFRQVKQQDGSWMDAAITPTTASELENTILTRARQIRLAQKEFH